MARGRASNYFPSPSGSPEAQILAQPKQTELIREHAEQPEPEKPDQERQEPQQPEPEKPEKPERQEPKQPEPQEPVPDQPNSQQVEAQPVAETDLEPHVETKPQGQREHGEQKPEPSQGTSAEPKESALLSGSEQSATYQWPTISAEREKIDEVRNNTYSYNTI